MAARAKSKNNAFYVHQCWMVYRQYLEENNLSDDSDTISVKEVIEFVEVEINDEYRGELLNTVDELYGLVKLH